MIDQKSRKQSKLADTIYFQQENFKQLENAKLLAQKGKKLLSSFTSEIQIIKDLMMQDFKFLRQPYQLPTKQKLSKSTNPKISKQISKIMKKTKFHQDKIELNLYQEILNNEKNAVFDTKVYRNCLVEKISQNGDSSFLFTYQCRQGLCKIVQFDYCVESQQSKFQESILNCQDKTGVYELLKMNENCKQQTFRTRCVKSLIQSLSYQIKEFRLIQNCSCSDIILPQIEQYKSIHVKKNTFVGIKFNYSSRFGGITSNSRLVLNKYELPNQLYKYDSSMSLPYRPITTERTQNPNTVLVQSMANIQILDLRTKQLSSLIQQSMNKLVDNRFYAVHAFQDTHYLVASTNSTFEFYDERSPKIPIQIQRHCCDESPIQQFVHQPQGAHYDDRIILGYSPTKNGMSVALRFKHGLIEQMVQVQCQICFDLQQQNQIQISKLIDGTLQNASFEAKINGFPQMVLTASQFDDTLKIRGMQIIQCLNKKGQYQNIVLSLDSRAGVGLQVLDEKLQSMNILSHNNSASSSPHHDSAQSSSVHLSQSEGDTFSNQSSYHSLFDKIYDYSDGELEPIIDSKHKKKELKIQTIKEKLKRIQIPQMNDLMKKVCSQKKPIQPERTDEIEFEDLLLRRYELERQNNKEPQKTTSLKYQKNFILDLHTLNDLRKDQE